MLLINTQSWKINTFTPLRPLLNQPPLSIFYSLCILDKNTKKHLPTNSLCLRPLFNFFIFLLVSLLSVHHLSHTGVLSGGQIEDGWVNKWMSIWTAVDAWIDNVGEWRWMAIKLVEWMDGDFNGWTQGWIGEYFGWMNWLINISEWIDRWICAPLGSNAAVITLEEIQRKLKTVECCEDVPDLSRSKTQSL